jgi:hypothetical protein
MEMQTRDSGLAGVRLGKWIALGLLLAGCAGGSAQVAATSLEELPRPGIAFIYPFAVDANDAAADTFGYHHESTNAEARQVASALAEKIVAALRQRGIVAQRGLRSSSPPLRAVVVKGQFVRIDKGSGGERVIIGFSAGSEDVRIRLQAYQVAETGLHRLQMVSAEAHGRKSPGVAVPAGVSIATANPAGLVISGGVNLASELLDGFDERLDDLAAQVADVARDFYASKGWL